MTHKPLKQPSMGITTNDIKSVKSETYIGQSPV